MRPFSPATLLLLCAVLTLGGGCQLAGDYTVTKRSAIDSQIAAARAETQTKLETLRKQETEALNQTITALKAREQSAADYLFKGVATYGSLKRDQISRPTLVMGQSIEQTAAQLPPATPAAQAAAFKALQTELDETKVSTEQLRAQYEAELGRARTEGEQRAQQVAKLEEKVKAVEAEKQQVLGEALTKEQQLQAAKDKVQDKATADALRDKAEAERNEKLKLYLMIGLGVVALAAGAAAIYVPIPSVKRYGAIVAIVAAGLGFAVPFITPMVALIAMACICVPVGLRIAFLYKRDHEDLRDTVRGIQEVKTKQPEVFKATIAPVLTTWHTKEQQQRVDEHLKAAGDL